MKVRERKDISFRYIEPASLEELEKMRLEKYKLEQELDSLREHIAELVKKYIREKNKLKRKVKNEIKDIKEYLSHGGIPVEKLATMVVDEHRGKIYCKAGAKRVRFLHKGQWVVERNMTDEEYDMNEFFDDEVEYDEKFDLPNQGSIKTICLSCGIDFETPKDINNKPLYRTCSTCKKKAKAIV